MIGWDFGDLRDAVVDLPRNPRACLFIGLWVLGAVLLVWAVDSAFAGPAEPLDRPLSSANFVQTVEDLQSSQDPDAAAFMQAVLAAKAANTGKISDVYEPLYGSTPRDIGKKEIAGQQPGVYVAPLPTATPITIDNVDSVAGDAIAARNRDAMYSVQVSVVGWSFDPDVRPHGAWLIDAQLTNTGDHGVRDMAGTIEDVTSALQWPFADVAIAAHGTVMRQLRMLFDPNNMQLVQLRASKTEPSLVLTTNTIVFDDGERFPIPAQPTATPAVP